MGMPNLCINRYLADLPILAFPLNGHMAPKELIDFFHFWGFTSLPKDGFKNVLFLK